jgi:hypothetical protein
MSMPRPEGTAHPVGAGFGGAAGMPAGGGAAAGVPPEHLVPELAEVEGTDSDEDETTDHPTANTEPDPRPEPRPHHDDEPDES